MILKPKVVVLDEPTSALDRSVQKEIVELLRDLQEAHGLSYLFISHDLAVVRAMADEVIVMKEGKVVERGCTEEIFADPKDPYTQALMAAAFQTIEAKTLACPPERWRPATRAAGPLRITAASRRGTARSPHVRAPGSRRRSARYARAEIRPIILDSGKCSQSTSDPSFRKIVSHSRCSPFTRIA